MAWRTMDVREQRVRFVVAALRREKSMAELCREFGISRPVGYEWLRRYEAGGVEGIAERSRRPQHSPRRKEAAIEQQVIALRQSLSRLGSAQAAGPAAGARGGVGAQHHSSHLAAAWVWCIQKTGTSRRRSASSAADRTSCGRWTSKVRSCGISQWGRCRCSTTTAAT